MLWVFGALVYGLRPLVARPQGRPSFDACLIATSRIAPTVESSVSGFFDLSFFVCVGGGWQGHPSSDACRTLF